MNVLVHAWRRPSDDQRTRGQHCLEFEENDVGNEKGASFTRTKAKRNLCEKAPEVRALSARRRLGQPRAPERGAYQTTCADLRSAKGSERNTSLAWLDYQLLDGSKKKHSNDGRSSSNH